MPHPACKRAGRANVQVQPPTVPAFFLILHVSFFLLLCCLVCLSCASLVLLVLPLCFPCACFPCASCLPLVLVCLVLPLCCNFVLLSCYLDVSGNCVVEASPASFREVCHGCCPNGLARCVGKDAPCTRAPCRQSFPCTAQCRDLEDVWLALAVWSSLCLPQLWRMAVASDKLLEKKELNLLTQALLNP